MTFRQALDRVKGNPELLAYLQQLSNDATMRELADNLQECFQYRIDSADAWQLACEIVEWDYTQ